MVTKDLVAAGVSAAGIISEAATELGAADPAYPDLAQAGGPHGDRLDETRSIGPGTRAERSLGSP